MSWTDAGDDAASLRWDFVTDPPTKLLGELQAARSQFHRGRFSEAVHASRRLLRHLADRLPAGVPAAAIPPGMAVIGADGRAVLALAAHALHRPEGAGAVEQSVAEYRALLTRWPELRPPSLADYGMVLAVSGEPAEAVEPMVRAVEAGEDVAQVLVRDAAAALLAQGLTSEAVRLLRAVHERYPWDSALAIDLAGACERHGDRPAAADAHVAAGALCAEAGRYKTSLKQFRRAGKLVPGHPLAALGLCQAMLVLGELPRAVAALDQLTRDQPALAGARAVAALVYAQLGDTDRAVATVEDALAQPQFRNDPWLLDTRVRVLRRAGDTDAALAAVDRALLVDATDRTWRGLRAELLMERGRDVEEALQTLRELVASAPHGTHAAVRLVLALRRLGRREEALDVVVRALGDHGQEPQLVVSEVELLSELGRSPEAVRHAEAALRRGMAVPALHLALAEALLRLESTGRAVEAAGRAVDVDPGSARAHRALGLAHLREGHVAPAVQELRTAVSLGADDEATRSALADGLLRLSIDESQDIASARANLESALELEPENSTARLRLANLLRGQGDHSGALRHVELGIGYDSANSNLLATRALIHQALGRLTEVEADLRAALELDPGLTWARAELGELLRTRGRFREALTQLQRAVTENPDQPWVLSSKGATEYALDLFDEAEQSIGRALDLDPDYTWARGVRAVILADTDDLAGARQEAARVLEQDPTIGWCWVLTGSLALFEEDAFDPESSDAAARAVAAFRRARELDDEDVTALVGLAEATVILGDEDEATRLFTATVETDASTSEADASLQAALGWALLRLSRYQEAVDRFLRALSLDPSLNGPSFDVALALLCAGRIDVGMAELHHALGRTASISHKGRRRAVLREFSRDLEALARAQLRDRTDEVETARAALKDRRKPDARLRPGGLQVSPA